MLVEQIIKQTVDLQGFRVHTVTKDPDGLIAEIRPDTRYRIRCGTCGHPAVYRDMRDARLFPPCSFVEYSGVVQLSTSPGALLQMWRRPHGATSLGDRQAAHDPCL
jgi:hypothetical protein